MHAESLQTGFVVAALHSLETMRLAMQSDRRRPKS
jgi:hypothetical protein